MPGLLVVVSGPSGAGKGTLCNALRSEWPHLGYSVSATTRQPRPGESNGVNYFFYTPAQFTTMIEQNHFLEWAFVYGNYYGTPRAFVEEKLSAGEDVLLEIDIQGALQVKKQYDKGVFIFVAPPSMEELRRRITLRGTEPPDIIRQRLEATATEVAYAPQYDYVVINQDLRVAVEEIKAIIIAEKCRPFRRPIRL
ncbi:MAG: guanylate kinase [Bacillota bacterium]